MNVAVIAIVDGQLPRMVPSPGAGNQTGGLRVSVVTGVLVACDPAGDSSMTADIGRRNDEDQETHMKRLLMVALTLGLAAAASLAFAGTTEAQAEEGPGDPIPATMQLSPEVAAPGEQVTAQSITPCYPEGLVEWHVIEL
ncbi:MAG: hypothetical protein ACRD07_22860, partial [Acidimicrobiales bacterium]